MSLEHYFYILCLSKHNLCKLSELYEFNVCEYQICYVNRSVADCLNNLNILIFFNGKHVHTM